MMKPHATLALCAAALLGAAGCQHGADHAAHDSHSGHDKDAAHHAHGDHDKHAAHDSHAGHDKDAAHHAHGDHDKHGDHHGHAASQPHTASQPHDSHAGHGTGHDLKPLMRAMLVHVVGLQDALTAKDAQAARTHAAALAGACKGGEEHAHHNLPAEWGPDFVTVDRALHQGAEKLSQALQHDDLAKATGMYVGVVAQCQACHAQAPVAQAVRLGRLLQAP